MKITSEKIGGLLDEFRTARVDDLGNFLIDQLSEFLARKLAPKIPDSVAKRESLELKIYNLGNELEVTKMALKDFQDNCPHIQTKARHKHDGMTMSKCVNCHKMIYTQERV